MPLLAIVSTWLQSACAPVVVVVVVDVVVAVVVVVVVGGGGGGGCCWFLFCCCCCCCCFGCLLYVMSVVVVVVVVVDVVVCDEMVVVVRDVFCDKVDAREENKDTSIHQPAIQAFPTQTDTRARNKTGSCFSTSRHKRPTLSLSAQNKPTTNQSSHRNAMATHRTHTLLSYPSPRRSARRGPPHSSPPAPRLSIFDKTVV